MESYSLIATSPPAEGSKNAKYSYTVELNAEGIERIEIAHNKLTLVQSPRNGSDEKKEIYQKIAPPDRDDYLQLCRERKLFDISFHITQSHRNEVHFRFNSADEFQAFINKLKENSSFENVRTTVVTHINFDGKIHVKLCKINIAEQLKILFSTHDDQDKNELYRTYILLPANENNKKK